MKNYNDMETGKIILISVTEDQLKNWISDAVKEAMDTTHSSPLLTFKQTMHFLQIGQSTLNKWKAQGTIPYKKMNKRIYFCKDEIMEALNEAGNYYKLRKLR